MKCDLDPSYGPVSFCHQDKSFQNALTGQLKFLVQNFLSMLIKFPEGYAEGLSPWWNVSFLKLTGEMASDYVKTNMRDEYGDVSQWTPECADVLSLALALVHVRFYDKNNLGDESSTCDTQCFIDAFRRGLDSLK